MCSGTFTPACSIICLSLFTFLPFSSFALAGFMFSNFSYGLPGCSINVMYGLSACDFYFDTLCIGLFMFFPTFTIQFTRISQSKLYVIVK